MQGNNSHLISTCTKRDTGASPRQLRYTIVPGEVSDISNQYCASGRKEGNVLFNDALNTFILLLYGVRQAYGCS